MLFEKENGLPFQNRDLVTYGLSFRIDLAGKYMYYAWWFLISLPEDRMYCEGRNFRSFRIIEKCTKLISIPNFLPPGLQTFRSPLLVFTFFGQFDSTKLNSI